MNPYIFVLLLLLIIASIPVSIVFFHSPLGKAIARYIEVATKEKLSKKELLSNETLRQEFDRQDRLLSEVKATNDQLQEKYEFLERLLEENHE